MSHSTRQKLPSYNNLHQNSSVNPYPNSYTALTLGCRLRGHNAKPQREPPIENFKNGRDFLMRPEHWLEPPNNRKPERPSTRRPFVPIPFAGAAKTDKSAVWKVAGFVSWAGHVARDARMWAHDHFTDPAGAHLVQRPDRQLEDVARYVLPPPSASQPGHSYQRHRAFEYCRPRAL
jgi:hypothetical protein